MESQSVTLKKCCVPGCQDKKSMRHRFPKADRKMCEKWLSIINPPNWTNLTIEQINKKYFVCNAHFDKKYALPGSRRRLTVDAVPTIGIPGNNQTYTDVHCSIVVENAGSACSERSFVNENYTGERRFISIQSVPTSSTPVFSAAETMGENKRKVGEVVTKGKESKEKLGNLQNSLVKNLRIIPNESSVKRKRPQYLSNAMQFLLPLVKVQGVRNRNMLKVPKIEKLDIPSTLHEIKIDVQDSMLGDFQPHTTSSPLPAELHHIPDAPLPSTLIGSSSIAFENFSELPGSKKIKKVASLSNNSDQISVNLGTKKSFEEKQNVAENPNLDSEAMRLFLLSLMPDLAMLTPTQKRTFKRRTLDLIEQLLDMH